MTFLIFAGFNYYPEGGAKDLMAIAFDINDAISSSKFIMSKHTDYQWSHVFCVETNDIVFDYDWRKHKLI